MIASIQDLSISATVRSCELQVGCCFAQTRFAILELLLEAVAQTMTKYLSFVELSFCCQRLSLGYRCLQNDRFVSLRRRIVG